MLASSVADLSASDGGKKAGHRGERAISRKPLRREGRMLSAEPVCSCAFPLCTFAHETAGAARTRSSLRPLIGEDAKGKAKLARNARRDREAVVVDHTLPVIARESGRSSIPETSVIEPRSRGVLDTPHARGMTARYDGEAIAMNGQKRLSLRINPAVTSFIYTLPTISRLSRALVERVVSCCVSRFWPRRCR